MTATALNSFPILDIGKCGTEFLPSTEMSNCFDMKTFEASSCFSPPSFLDTSCTLCDTWDSGFSSEDELQCSTNSSKDSFTFDWSRFCPDDECIYKMDRFATKTLYEGNFYEVNGSTVDLDEEYPQKDSQKWKRGYRKDKRRKRGDDEVENQTTKFGAVGDRDTKLWIKRNADEETMKFKSEALSRLTWDPSKKCVYHKEPLYIFCDECKKTVCSKCITEFHQTHRLTPKNFQDTPQTTAKKLKFEVQSVMKNVEELMKNILATLKKIDLNAANVIKNVISLLNNWEYIGSCVHRKDYLMKLIKSIRDIKKYELIDQNCNLLLMFERLNEDWAELTKALLLDNTNVFLAINAQVREDLTLIERYDYGLIPIHNAEFRIDTNSKIYHTDVRKKASTLTVSAPTVCESIKTMSLRRIPFESKNYQKAIQPLKVGACIFGANGGVSVAKHSEGVRTFGGEGAEDGKLCRPWGICCDSDGCFYVSDRSNNRVQVYNPDGSFKFNFGKLGDGPDELNRPAGIIVDYQNRILIADKDNHRVQVFARDGKHLFHFGKFGRDAGEFHYPWDVASNSTGQIAVSDTKNRRVQIFNGDGALNGVVEFYPYDLKLFDLPRGLKYNKAGELVVGDFNNHRFIVFDQTYTTFRIFGSDAEFNRPQGLCIDDDGNYVIADSKNNRVVIYDQRTKFVREIVLGEEHGTLGTPQGVCVTPDGRVAVVGLDNHRVHVI